MVEVKTKDIYLIIGEVLHDVFCRFTRAEFAELDSVIDRKLRLKNIAKIKR